MRNPTERSTINNNISFDEMKKNFDAPTTIENISHFFSPGFPPVLLEADHFIDLLKRRALWDEAGACKMIDFAASNLSAIIHDQRTFGLFYRTLSQSVLSHLFSRADFIPSRFFSNLAGARIWLLDTSYSSAHRLFLFKFYQQHFINLFQSQPFTVGILSTLLSFLEQMDEKETVFVKEIISITKLKIIDLFKEPNLLLNLRYFFLHNITSDEFTLLIREIPEIFELLCNIEDPKFFPPIQFERLPPEQQTQIQIQLIHNLITYYEKQKGYPAFFTPTYHAEDNHFISTIKNILAQPDIKSAEKLIEIQKNIDANYALLSIYIRKLLKDRQFQSKECDQLTFRTETR